MGHHGHQVVVRVDLPVDARVEQDVAGIGAAIGRRRQERHGQCAGAQGDGTDADVAESRIVLLVAGVATASPPSETCARFRLAAFSQIDAACSICCSQVAVGNFALSVEKSALGTPPTLVPSGIKL